MLVSIDGGETWKDVDEVRVSYKNLSVYDDYLGVLDLKATNEGFGFELWQSSTKDEDALIVEDHCTIDEFLDEWCM